MLPEDKKAMTLCFSKTIKKELKYLYLILLYIVNTFIVFFKSNHDNLWVNCNTEKMP